MAARPRDVAKSDTGYLYCAPCRGRSSCILIGCSRPTRASARWRARSMRRCGTCRSSARTATPIRPGSPTNAPFADAAGPAAGARPLPLPHALQPGRAAGGAGRSDAQGRAAGRPARGLAAVRQPLHLVPRHALGALARPCVRARCSASTCAWRPTTADLYFDRIGAAAGDAAPSGRGRSSSVSTSRCWPPPRVPTDELRHHQAIRESGWRGRVITRLPPRPGRRSRARGFLGLARAVRRAHRPGRLAPGAAIWRPTACAARPSSPLGATSTDHGHPSAATADLSAGEAEALFDRILAGRFTPAGRRAVPRPDADRDGADEPRRRPGDADPPGLVPQPQPRALLRATAATRAPTSRSATDYVRALKPLLDRFGNEPRPDASSSSPWTRPPTAANSRRSPATIRR